ncbi:MAG: metallophosphoesterase [Desulfuromonadaceae bacterium]|nr:metallophosphoesterase [Desulfuromonadaceae bacterium]
MKALVISDTHGNVNRAFAAYTLAEPVDLIIHLGDGCADADLLREALEVPVINVAGNCDPGSNAPRERLWECEGKRILLTHGDAYQVKSGLARLRQRAEEIGADAVLFGHTHHVVLERLSGLLLINPGSLTNSSNRRSYAVLDITPESITSRHYDIG